MIKDIKQDLERTKNVAQANLEMLSLINVNEDLVYYKIQVGNYLRRINTNCNEALEYLAFLTGEREVKK